MPESTTDRPTSAIEYVFLMAKSAKYYYDGEAIRVPATESTKERANYGWHGKMVFDDNGHETRSQPDPIDKVGDRWCPPTRNYRNSDPFFESWQGLYSEAENPLAFIINPQARPELHFASFPNLLAETCIKAGTSEYGCCPKCGTPWQRIVEKNPNPSKWAHDENDRGVPKSMGGNKQSSKSLHRNGNNCQMPRGKTTGWQSNCKCKESERIPCTVLDPFMGRGTVAIVARGLGRSSIGCELNPDYIEIIKQQLQSNSCLDTGTVEYIFTKV